MTTRMITIALVTAVSMAMATSVTAAPPHGDGGHTHHVHTGNGGCVDVDAVAFLGGDRGLHQGASSSGSEQGVWHGACH